MAYKDHTLTQNRLKEILKYHPESGNFTWITPTNISIKAGTKAGSLCKTHGYIFIGIDCVVYAAHRLAWLYTTGRWPKFQIDHINHVKVDNRWNNLREVNSAENQRNASIRVDNKSRVTGVCWHKPSQKWQSCVNVNKVRVYLGIFDNFFEAVCARKSAEIRYGFHQNHGKG